MSDTPSRMDQIMREGLRIAEKASQSLPCCMYNHKQGIAEGMKEIVSTDPIPTMRSEYRPRQNIPLDLLNVGDSIIVDAADAHRTRQATQYSKRVTGRRYTTKTRPDKRLQVWRIA